MPSHGVDPAPLAELNAECLGLLAARAAQGVDRLAPRLLVELHAEWADLPNPAVDAWPRRLSACSTSVVPVRRLLETRARGVNDQSQRNENQFFATDAARSITRRMLVYAWHLARSRPRAACLVFGSTIPAVEALAACSLAALEAAAEGNAEALKPRSAHRVPFWRELLAAASADEDTRLRELLLGGIQLAAETLTAHPP